MFDYRYLGSSNYCANMTEFFLMTKKSRFCIHLLRYSTGGLMKFVNNSFAEMLGYTPEEIVGCQYWEFVHPGDREMVKKISLDRARGEAAPAEYEFRHLRKDGRTVWVHNLPTIIQYQGQTSNMGILAYITERKQTEEALRESEEKFRSFIENSPVAMFEINTKGEFTYANKKLVKMTGYDPEEWANKPFNTFEDLSIAMEKMQKRLSGQGSSEPYEIRVYHASGDILWVNISPEPVYETDESGKKRLVGVQCFVQDVTSRKLAEQALTESEGKFRLISEQSLMAIAIIQDNRIIWANQAYSEIYGYTLEEIMNWTLVDAAKLIHPDDYDFVVKQGLKETAGIREGVVTQCPYRVVTKSGEVRWVDQYSKTIMHGEKPANLMISIDIHEQKLAQEALRESEEKYRALITNIPDVT